MARDEPASSARGQPTGSPSAASSPSAVADANAAARPALDRGGIVNVLARIRRKLAEDHEGPHRLTVVQHRLVLDRLATDGMIAPVADCGRGEQLEAVVAAVSEVVGVDDGVVRAWV